MLVSSSQEDGEPHTGQRLGRSIHTELVPTGFVQPTEEPEAVDGSRRVVQESNAVAGTGELIRYFAGERRLSRRKPLEIGENIRAARQYCRQDVVRQDLDARV